MNRTAHIQPTLAMGFAAQGIGSSCAMRLRKFEPDGVGASRVDTTH
jgi:hypothetical protein